MGSLKKVSQIMSVAPNQGYPPQGQPQPGIPPPPPMVNNSTIINNTPAPAPRAPLVINVNQKKKVNPAPAPDQSENTSRAGFLGFIILVLVVLAIGLGVWFTVKGAMVRARGPECTSSSSCSSGICDENECIACKDIGTTSIDCLMHSFSDTSGQAREDCNDICVDKAQACTFSSDCSSGICDHNECIACQDIETTSLDCIVHSFSNTSGQAREDCYDICADKDDWCRKNCDLQIENCLSSSAGFQCKCKDGYSGTPCVDINECLSCSGNASDCPCNSAYYPKCINTEGSFECVDWCFENHCDKKKQNCVSSSTGYHCECKAAYSGRLCFDIDECSSCSGGASNDCPCDTANEVCINTDGSFECEYSPAPSSFSVSWGAIVDAFIVNGVRYGKSSNTPDFESYYLNAGETLNEVQFGTCGFQGRQIISDLYFRTSAGREFGPFGECNAGQTWPWASPFIGPYTRPLDQARIGEQISTVVASDGYSYVTSFHHL